MPEFPDPVSTDIILPKGPVTADFRQSLSTALNGMIPDGKKGVVLGVATQTGFVVGVAHRVNDHWIVGADVSKKWNGPIEGRVMVMGSW